LIGFECPALPSVVFPNEKLVQLWRSRAESRGNRLRNGRGKFSEFFDIPQGGANSEFQSVSIDLTGDSHCSVHMKADSTPRAQPVPENRRGMPSWRTRQRSLPVAEKIALLGRFIQETRQLERVKNQWKLSAMS